MALQNLKPKYSHLPTDLAERFGADAKQLLEDMLQTADPLADAATEALLAQRDLADALQRGIAFGSDTVADLPTAVRQLLHDAESVPDWVDPSRLARGVDAYLSIGALWLGISLGPGSLAHTYSSPSIAQVLMTTGNLQTRAMRRLQETANWQYHTLRPGGLARGTPGYVHTLQVRMLHARVRANLLARGWDGASGAPINQLEMMRTWLDFTAVPFNALVKLGIEFTQDELGDLYHVWQLVAHLLGIDARFYRRVSDQASGEQMLALIDAASGEPSAASATLTEQMLISAGHRLAPMLKLPDDVAVGLMQAFCRLFHGDEMADKLGVPRSWWASMLPMFADANRYQRLQERQHADVRMRKQQTTLGAFDQLIGMLKGDTTYQRNLTAGEAAHELPVSISEG